MPVRKGGACIRTCFSRLTSSPDAILDGLLDSTLHPHDRLAIGAKGRVDVVGLWSKDRTAIRLATETERNVTKLAFSFVAGSIRHALPRPPPSCFGLFYRH